MNKLMHFVSSGQFAAGLLGFFAILLTSCRSVPTPAPPSITPLGAVSVEAGKTLVVTANSPGATTYQWTLDGPGSIPSVATVGTIRYTAPDNMGESVAILSVVASNPAGSSPAVTLTINILSAPTPTPTNTPTPVPTPTSTPPLPPLPETFLQGSDGEEFSFNNDGVFSNDYTHPNCIHSGSSGLRLAYEMTGAANGGWGVSWTNTPVGYFDTSRFTSFTFWVNVESGSGKFQVGLKDTREVETKVQVVALPGWQQATIHLSNFRGVNIALVRNVNFGFNNSHGSGAICIDDIAFR